MTSPNNNNNLDQILTSIIQDIRSGRKPLPTSTSHNNSTWNIWDDLTHSLHIQSSSVKILQSYRLLVKQHLLTLLRSAGFKGEVCERCLDPMDVHEGADHKFNSSDIDYEDYESNHQETMQREVGDAKELRFLRDVCAKEREDWKGFCLKRAEMHDRSGNLAFLVAGAFLVLLVVVLVGRGFEIV